MSEPWTYHQLCALIFADAPPETVLPGSLVRGDPPCTCKRLEDGTLEVTYHFVLQPPPECP